MTKDAGLSLIIWDTNPLGTIKQFGDLGSRHCPFDNTAMLMTKAIGDWFPTNLEGNAIRFQWKCPTCFLTHHETHPRLNPSTVDQDPLTDKEKQIIEDRLKKLGYFE
jgi:hypothetical protein